LLSTEKLNLGSGKDWRKDCVNADIQARTNPDWVCDIANVKWGEVIDTRHGTIEIRHGMFKQIIANDVLEHIPDLVAAMTNCRDLLAKDGEMHIHVPYDLSYGAWQDPTHVRAFNERSWLYYTDWAWYLGWQERFYLREITYELSEIGEAMAKEKIPTDEIIRTPRAVDAMRVILTKGE
jgi:SAM-dependent methyltransferase